MTCLPVFQTSEFLCLSLLVPRIPRENEIYFMVFIQSWTMILILSRQTRLPYSNDAEIFELLSDKCTRALRKLGGRARELPLLDFSTFSPASYIHLENAFEICGWASSLEKE
jgi:hypothetical protein